MNTDELLQIILNDPEAQKRLYKAIENHAEEIEIEVGQFRYRVKIPYHIPDPG